MPTFAGAVNTQRLWRFTRTLLVHRASIACQGSGKLRDSRNGGKKQRISRGRRLLRAVSFHRARLG